MFFTLTSLVSIMVATATAMPSSVRPLDTRNSSAGMPDINAIKAVSPSSFQSYQTGGLVRASMKNSTVSKRCASSATFTWGDTDNGGKGLLITNADSDWRGFYVYDNNCDNMPSKYIWINAGDTKFISLPDNFQGRVTRGVDSTNLDGQTQMLATWLEVSFDSSGWIWGDVSLIRGCDGGSLMWSLDGSGAWKGFTQWILDGAPEGSYDMKNDGQWVLKATENSDGSINTAPRDWELSQVGSDYVYVDDYHGNPVITSTDGRLGTYWPAGRP